MGGPVNFFMQRYGKYFEEVPDLDACLARIGLTGEQIPLTRAGLDKVQWAFLTSVPFENIDLFDYDLNVDFGIPDLFDKIITRRRGGYCFELNAFFMALLQTLGFEAHAVGGRIMPATDVDYTPAISHRMTIVTIDGKRYVTDVGFGMTNAPGGCICVDDYELQQVRGEPFSVEDRPYNNKMIIRHKEDGPANLFMFIPDPFPILDFIAINSNMSRTGFRVKRTANLRTETGAISVDGNIFRETINGERIETPIADADDALKVLTEKYGMVLTEPLAVDGDRTPPPPTA